MLRESSERGAGMCQLKSEGGRRCMSHMASRISPEFGKAYRRHRAAIRSAKNAGGVTSELREAHNDALEVIDAAPVSEFTKETATAVINLDFSIAALDTSPARYASRTTVKRMKADRAAKVRSLSRADKVREAHAGLPDMTAQEYAAVFVEDHIRGESSAAEMLHGYIRFRNDFFLPATRDYLSQDVDAVHAGDDAETDFLVQKVVDMEDAWFDETRDELEADLKARGVEFRQWPNDTKSKADMLARIKGRTVDMFPPQVMKAAMEKYWTQFPV